MMSNATVTLTDFLLARIEEEESVARQAEVDLGRFDRENVANGGKYTGTQGAITLLAMRDGNAMDPERVLAECEARRQIVALCADSIEKADARVEDLINRAFNGGAAYVAHNALLRLASAYADHPDHQQEWRA